MTKQADLVYNDLVYKILNEGVRREDRTGVGTLSYFGYQYRLDLREGFPILSTKKVNFEAVKAELLWFLSGSSNVNDLPEEYRFIWKPWSDPDGEVWFSYGREWISSTKYVVSDDTLLAEMGINQLNAAIRDIKCNPKSRRIIVSSWNTPSLYESRFYPCHVLQQYYVDGEYLDLMLTQRSLDVAVGCPFNMSSYSLLLSMLAKECNLTPRYFIHSIGDAHIYLNHVDRIMGQVIREPYDNDCSLEIADKYFWDLESEDISLKGYNHHPFIKYDVAV